MNDPRTELIPRSPAVSAARLRYLALESLVDVADELDMTNQDFGRALIRMRGEFAALAENDGQIVRVDGGPV